MSASERPVRGHDSALPEAAPAYQHGLTKREYIAAQLAAGMLANQKGPTSTSSYALLEELAK